MKVGDLVMRTDRLVRDSLGVGIVINIQDTHEKNMPFYQVIWQRGATELYWYDSPELELISEAR